MKGKKGFDISMNFVIMWIILPLVAGVMIVLLVVAPTASALGSKGYADSLCHLNAGIRDKMLVGKILIPLFMCKEHSATIDADNWNACDPDGRFKFKDRTDIKGCAEQQIFNLMSRCWYVYGQSSWNFAAGNWDYDCFRFQIRDLGAVINEKTLTSFMMQQKFDNGKNYCSEIANNNPIPACGNKDQVFWGDAFGNPKELKAQEIWRVRFHDDVPLLGVQTGNDQIVLQK